ncbi:TRAP transporter small permease [Nitrincola alkalisediminis]|uniref:TRAP transporter small permease n=1 Tax=Nitrincola alkalisediminis TaxID=1366656 RepID=UPI001875E77C|nr:TRAP transporter small permease [Nitrincola alkalisediminis]
MRRYLDTAFATLGAIVVTIFAVIMALIFMQVINRFFLGLPLFWTEEVVRMLLVWMVLLGTPVVVYQCDEIKVELFHFKNKHLETCRYVLVAILSIIFCAFLAYWGYRFTLRALGTMQPSLGISRAWLYAPISLGGMLTIIAFVVRRDALNEQSDEEDLT